MPGSGLDFCPWVCRGVLTAQLLGGQMLPEAWEPQEAGDLVFFGTFRGGQIRSSVRAGNGL